MIRIRVAAPFMTSLALLTLSGCASSLSGVGGTQDYACKAPEGALCTSISGVFANSTQGTLRPTPLTLNLPAIKPSATPTAGASATSPVVLSAAASDTVLDAASEAGLGSAFETDGAPTPAPRRATLASVPDRATVRANARVLRVWIAPWEDSDGDLHEAALVHVLVDTGRWLIEHVRPASRSSMQNVAPPIAPVRDSTHPGAPSDSTSPTNRFPLPPGPIPSRSATPPNAQSSEGER